MSCYAVQFEDDPARLAVRTQALDAHRAFLAAHADRVLTAGVLCREGGDAAGELWLLRVSSELEARELIEADPYFVQGLRRTVRVWRYVDASPGRGAAR